jgi:hypothetical protein
MLDIKNLEGLEQEQLEQLQILANPLRLKIFTEFGSAKTVTKAAEGLKMDRNQLYYQLRIMRKVGLIKKVDSHQVGHLIESVYQSIERLNFERRNIENPGPKEPYFELICGMAKETWNDCERSLSRGGNLKAATSRKIFKVKKEDMGTVPKQISKLMKEFMASLGEFNDDDGDVDYSVTLTQFEM